eukprot:scaffold83119_cov37-Prasinocladus_malaysianus.AAC.1
MWLRSAKPHPKRCVHEVGEVQSHCGGIIYTEEPPEAGWPPGAGVQADLIICMALEVQVRQEEKDDVQCKEQVCGHVHHQLGLRAYTTGMATYSLCCCCSWCVLTYHMIRIMI